MDERLASVQLERMDSSAGSNPMSRALYAWLCPNSHWESAALRERPYKSHAKDCICRTFLLNRERAVDYLNMLDRLYVFDGYAGWDPVVSYHFTLPGQVWAPCRLNPPFTPAVSTLSCAGMHLCTILRIWLTIKAVV